MALEQLIPIINKLQDVFHSVGMLDTIDLPQIAVVGSQSSGKSSVLESIVGRDFLPRGTGIVTRRPLVLQLTHVPRKKATTGTKTEDKDEEWGEFMHVPNKKFFDFDEIRQEIVAETDRITGANKGISSSPIHLRIYSPNVLNLTLIDLPGVTKVPVGDQPKDIERQIRRMIVHFIEKPNCIILAVTAANTDLANSDALKLAREVDPKGERTLGVLTKTDLMDKGTDVMDALHGKVYNLRKGFIAVVNRGQQDILANKPIKDAINDEMIFFKNHPAYKSIVDRLGTRYLSRTLNQVLLHHIRETLPDIKNKITALIVQAQQRLAEYGEPLTESNMSQGAVLLQLLTEFSTEYTDAIDGRNPDISTNELFGGARINYIFTRKYTPYLSKMDAGEGLTEYDIRTAIRNAKGPRTSLFIPEASFEMLVKRQVKMLEEPSLRCVDQVYEELKAIMEHSNRVLMRFPSLRERTQEFVTSMLKTYAGPLKEFIRNLIAIELSYINTNHPDFFGGGQTAFMLMEKMQQMKEDSVDGGENQQYQQQAKSNGQDPRNRQQQHAPLGRRQRDSVGDLNDWHHVRGEVAKPVKNRAQRKTNFLSNLFGNSSKGSNDQREQEQSSEVIVQNLLGGEEENALSSSPSTFSDHSSHSSMGSHTYTFSGVENPSSSGMPDIHDRERMETDVIRSLLNSYFNIVRKNVSDTVPKSIMHFLVNKSKQSLQSELVRALYKEELFDDLLSENEEIAAKRKATMKMLRVLQKANDVLSEIREIKL